MHSIKDIVKQLIGKSLDAYNTKYTKVLNTRIDNIVAQAGNDNTEIVDARIDSAGVTHTTLNNRILAETKMNDEQLVEYTGSSLSVDDTMPGYLQNIEIKGNTIQNEDNLEDIRSVGDKIEGQELYEIPVLSRGKNLFDSTFEIGGIFWATGKDNNSEIDRVRTGYIRVKPNTEYIISEKNLLLYSVSHVFYLNKNKEFISLAQPSNGTPKISFSTPSDCFYIRLLRMGQGTSTDIYTQLEEGTVTTPYEPYQEDKLTILSPVQLEKVGDVADRIICKDGVWGVEKNVGDGTLIGTESWTTYNNFTSDTMYSAYTSFPKFKSDSIIVINTHSSSNSTSATEEYISMLQNLAIGVLKTKANNASSLKAYLSSNPVHLKGILAQPQFIPLPHDQQVKLRTFANKTNISFLTEIEGTIKAQVPKSLGATVNTHTEQINNLNKELDRVKKLEESTVSTVETESDFTTVEATSNGYFEDVKLEGKTLVNICPKPNIYAGDGDIENRVVISGNVVELSLKEGYYTGVNFTSNSSLMKPNTTYTIVANILENTMTKGNLAIIEGNPDTSFNGVSIPLGYKGVFVTKATTRSSYTLPRIQSMTTTTCKTGEKVKFSLMVFEGDHTQNPPNGYIEGLKSVEQGTDEIVVSSVKGDGNLFNSDFWESGFISDSTGNYSDNIEYARSKKIRVIPNTLYTFKGYTRRIYYYDITGNFISKFDIGGGTFLEQTNSFTTPSNCAYIALRYDFKNSSSIITSLDMMKQYDTIICKNALKDGLIYQSDKKRLLYYNDETQTWEKPILREWDSIEKHADGKYYYHQRSGEVVLNGSEDWIIDNDATKETSLHFRLNGASYNLKPTNNNYSNAEFICDKFTLRNADFVWSTNTQNPNGVYEGIAINSSSFICVRVLKSKLSTQDVAGFKQWLQTNNVTVVYQLAQEKVYECTNIDLITYANETNYIVESGVIVPRTTLKVHNNISNVVSLLQKKVSLLESNMTKYMVTQNRMQLASTYSADSVTFKVDYFSLCGDEENYDEDLYNLILNNILVGKDNYNYDKMFTMILDYASWNQISWEQFDILVGLMDMQHNPPVEELPTEDEIEEDIIEETPVE